MSNIYSQEFLFHFKNQPYKKKIKKPTVTGKSRNISCGDEMEVDLLVKNGFIKDIGYNPNGCVVSSGAMSILADFVVGKKVAELKNLTKDEVIGLIKVELTPSRVHCALMGYNAIQEALKNV